METDTSCLRQPTAAYGTIRKINRLTSLLIRFDIRDIQICQMIKDRIKGNLNILSGNNAVRFTLHKYDWIVLLVNNINGLIRSLAPHK